jgi:ribonuclease HI
MAVDGVERADTELWIDGSCPKPNGPGAWAVIAVTPESWAPTGERVFARLSGGSFETTNNRMELQAAIEALRYARAIDGGSIEVFSDSQYVVYGVTKWLEGWKAKQFHKVKNVEHWLVLDKLLHDPMLSGRVEWTWVPGHVGWEHNELADELAGETTQWFKTEPVTLV